MNISNACKSQYLHVAIYPYYRATVIDFIIQKIENNKLDFDSIAFMGMSGALIVPTVADKLNKFMLLVRKNYERRHSCLQVEGYLNSKRYLIIDDIISSGMTIRSIVEKIHKATKGKAKCIGVLCYKSKRYRSLDQLRLEGYQV